jgi:hypothetical protein
MCHSRPRLHGCVEDHPALLLQLPVRVHSSHLIPPSAHVLHLPSSSLHHRDLGHHLLVIGQGTAPSLVAVFVSRRVLAFSLAECCGRGSSAIDLKERPVMIKPHQIISKTMGNIILLLSFGLCSPVLCAYVAVSICLHLCSWLLLIGRFVSVRMDALNAVRSSSHLTERGSLVSLSTVRPFL